MITTDFNTEKLKESAAQHLMLNYGIRDTVLVRGEGSRAWDSDGKEYLDFLSGIAVNNLGHCHPAIVEAIKTQSEQLIHCANTFLIPTQVELGELLCKELNMDRALFANSGAEVTEGAIKLARLWAFNKFGQKSTKNKILVFENSFHGRTYGAMSATWSEKVRHGFTPLIEEFIFAEFNSESSVEEHWSDDICGVLLETVQGEGGVTPATPEFLKFLREKCDEAGIPLICDEVQCGMGRSGKRMAYELADIQPDILPIAKALGGGFPIGAILARGEFAEVFQRGNHGTTFGGNPLACAAALASTRIIFNDDFLQNVSEMGCYLWGVLEQVGKAHPDLYDHVRGVGLMQGMVMKKECLPLAVIGRKKGLLFNVTAGKVLRILPPLIVTKEEIDQAGELLDQSITEFEGTL